MWTGPIVIFLIVPLADIIIGTDSSNPPDEMIEELENDKYYRYVTYAFLPLQYAGFIVAMYLVGTTDWPVIDKIGLAISIGCVGGIAINTAHELGHKREGKSAGSARSRSPRAPTATSSSSTTAVPHPRLHPEDPASSRIGELLPLLAAHRLRIAAQRLEQREEALRAQETHPFHWATMSSMPGR